MSIRSSRSLLSFNIADRKISCSFRVKVLNAVKKTSAVAPFVFISRASLYLNDVILPFPLHNFNLLRGEAVEFVDHFVNLAFKDGGVGAGVFLFGGEDLVNEGDKGLVGHKYFYFIFNSKSSSNIASSVVKS